MGSWQKVKVLAAVFLVAISTITLSVGSGNSVSAWSGDMPSCDLAGFDIFTEWHKNSPVGSFYDPQGKSSIVLGNPGGGYFHIMQSEALSQIHFITYEGRNALYQPTDTVEYQTYKMNTFEFIAAHANHDLTNGEDSTTCISYANNVVYEGASDPYPYQGSRYLPYGAFADTTAPAVLKPKINHKLVLMKHKVNFSAAATDAQSGVVRGEYYIDRDPGQGNGQTMIYSNCRINGSARILGLRAGTHKLYMRSVDAAGNWSVPVSVQFVYIGL